MIDKHMENINDEVELTVNNGPEHDEEVMTEPPVEYHHERNNSLPELFGDEAHQNDWEKYWAKNGERLIWQTWIEKYIDYINPEYLDKNNMQFYENTTSADTNKLDDTGSSEQVFTFDAKDIGSFNNRNENDNDKNIVPDSTMEIVISPPANKQTTEDLIIQGWNQLSPDSITKQEDYHNYSHSRHYQHQHHRHNNHQHNVSFHEIDNLLSPRCESINSSIPLTLGTGTDSMTNVTRMTCSSYGFGSSHVTSDSTSTSSEEEEDQESNTISSFSESEGSDNQMTTRVANECERLLMEHKTEHEHIPPAAEDKDSEEYWQMKWQQHVQEMYVKHYNEFMEAHRIISDEMSSSFKSDSGFLPGENAGKSHTFSKISNGPSKFEFFHQKLFEI